MDQLWSTSLIRSSGPPEQPSLGYPSIGWLELDGCRRATKLLLPLPNLDLCILLSFPSLGGCHAMRHRCRPPPNDSRNRSRLISRIRGLETPHDDGSSTSRRTEPSPEHHSPSPRPSVPCCAKRNGSKGSNHLSQPWVCWTSGPDHLVQAVVLLKLMKLERKSGIRASHSCHTLPDPRTHFHALMAMHMPSQASLASFNSPRPGLCGR